MKAEKFQEALSQVDDKYIEEASGSNEESLEKQSETSRECEIPGEEPGLCEEEKNPDEKETGAEMKKEAVMNSDSKKKRSGTVWKIIAIAACCCFAISAALAIISISGNSGSYKSADSKESGYSDTYYGNSTYDEDAYLMADYDYAVAEEAAEYEYAAGTAETSAWTSDYSETDSQNLLRENVKIIYTAYLDMQTTEFDEAVSQIEKLAESLDAYFENQDISTGYTGYRNAYFTVRVPVDNLDAFLNQVGDICTVQSISKNAQDITENYYDTQSRLDTAKTKLARLQELLAEAENMEDIITIESAISDTEWTIDDLSGTIRYYDSRVSYSTVTINLNEVYKVEKEEAPLTFAQKLSQSFEDGIEGICEFAEDFVIWIAQAWIGLLIIIALIVGVILIIRHIIKKHRKHREDKEE